MVPVDSVMPMKKQRLTRNHAILQNAESDKCLCKMVLAQTAQTGQRPLPMEDHADQTHAHCDKDSSKTVLA